MSRLIMISLVSFYILSACASVPKRSTDESMLNFLPYLNQKVSGYMEAHKLETLDLNSYRDIVNQVCNPLPSCGTKAEIMFDTYDIQVRPLNGMFSVMLCDKHANIKKIEDFSCNEQRVEIQNYQVDSKAPCAFETKWKESIAPFCPGDK